MSATATQVAENTDPSIYFLDATLGSAFVARWNPEPRTARKILRSQPIAGQQPTGLRPWIACGRRIRHCFRRVIPEAGGRARSLGRRRGVRNRWLDGLPFRREERLGRLALARDRLTVVTAEVVLLLPVIEQGSLRWSKPISS